MIIICTLVGLILWGGVTVWTFVHVLDKVCVSEVGLWTGIGCLLIWGISMFKLCCLVIVTSDILSIMITFLLL